MLGLDDVDEDIWFLLLNVGERFPCHGHGIDSSAGEHACSNAIEFQILDTKWL